MSFFQALQIGNLDMISQLIVKDQSIVNLKLANGKTALFFAAENGNEKICDILLTNRANPNLSGESGETPLHVAAGKGYINVVRSLLIDGDRSRKCAYVDETGGGRCVTALYRALQYKQVDVAHLLYQKGASLSSLELDKFKLLFWNDKLLNPKDLNRYSEPQPLAVAAQNGLIGLLERFIQNGAKITDNILSIAIQANQINSVKCLTEKGFVNVCQLYRNNTPLSEAAEKGNLEIVKYLLENGAQITIPSALSGAVQGNQTKIFKFLLSCKVNFKVENGSTMLLNAIELENTEVAGLLIKHGANINSGGLETPLLKATRTRNIAMIKLLLENGAMDTVSENCALAEAIAQRNMIVIELLLKYRSDPDYIAHVLIKCIKEGNPALLNYFLKRKVNFKAYQKLEENLLNQAMRMNDVLSVQYLIGAGVDHSSLEAQLNTFAQHNYNFRVYFEEVKEAASGDTSGANEESSK